MSDKERLFEALKARGYFWSYDSKVLLEEVGDDVFIEHAMKYADFDDIRLLFSLYDKERLFFVWERDLKNDLRFKKLNLLLARVFFGMDVEADFFTGGAFERERKLRLLAS